MSRINWSLDARKALALFATLNWPFGLWPLLRVDLYLKIRMTIAIVQVVVNYVCLNFTILFYFFFMFLVLSFSQVVMNFICNNKS